MFKHLLWPALIVLVLSAAACSGSSNGTPPAGSVTVQHTTEDIPRNVAHVRYYGYDGYGNQTYRSSEMAPSAAHRLEGVPADTAKITTEFHTSNHEELGDDIQPVFLSGGLGAIAPRYSGTLFIPSRVAVVDVDAPTGNVLVRGNLPLVKKACYPEEERCFAYDELNERLKQITGGIVPGFNLDDYEVIEWVLHDGKGNRDELNVEMKALGRTVGEITCGATWLPFQQCSQWDPKTLYSSVALEKKPWGLIWWPMYACPHRPCDDTNIIFDRCTEKEVALNKDKFNFIEASQHLRSLLTAASPSGKKRLIYFHCIQGADRTGTLHLMYALDNNPDISFADAFDRAWKGKKQGSDEAQLDYLHDDVKPMCTFVGLAYRYCQEKYGSDPKRCGDFADIQCKK
jgi:hypothetical protein